MYLQLVKILSVFHPYSKFHLSFEYDEKKVSFEIYYLIAVKSRRFSDYSELFFLGGGGCYAALMRPNKVETRLQLQNGLAKVQKLLGRIAIGCVRKIFMAWSSYFIAE